jgi:hypothetical protein
MDDGCSTNWIARKALYPVFLPKRERERRELPDFFQ